jgi:hypothetical protein
MLKPHYPTIKTTKQLICNYVVIIPWKYGELKIKFHVKNLWNSIVVAF